MWSPVYYLITEFNLPTSGTGDQLLPGCDPDEVIACVNGTTPVHGWTTQQGWSQEVPISTRYSKTV